MIWFLRRALVISSFLLLAGCGTAPSGSSTPAASTAHDDANHGSAHGEGPEHSTASPVGSSGSEPAASVAETGPVATLTRSGGMQGKMETLVVGGDGRLQLLKGDINGQVVKTAQAPQAQLDSLVAAFASREWQQLTPQYGHQVPDGFAYTISGGNKQIAAYDGAQNPPVLDTVLNQLNALWQVAQSGS